LGKLPDHSTEIAFKGVLERYENRPGELDSTCLADFVALYNYSKTKKGAAEVVDDGVHDDLDEEEGVDKRDDSWIKTESGWLWWEFRCGANSMQHHYP
jgi:hypothetical protein